MRVHVFVHFLFENRPEVRIPYPLDTFAPRVHVFVHFLFGNRPLVRIPYPLDTFAPRVHVFVHFLFEHRPMIDFQRGNAPVTSELAPDRQSLDR